QERGLGGVHRAAFELGPAPAEGLGQQLELPRGAGAAHQPVVVVDGDAESELVEGVHRVGRDGVGGSGLEVGGGADFEGDAPVADVGRETAESRLVTGAVDV